LNLQDDDFATDGRLIADLIASDMISTVIAVQPAQAVALFGTLGTHSKCAGATLWVRQL
jgi:hypothetical protein